jgi:pimeloyl-ACP methyl ester carboxylesterase
MPKINNIVLVHGGFVDGAGWRGVYDILKKDGFNVSIVQNPTITLAGDVSATKLIIDSQPGPVILVGHSYGGAVITEAGTAPNVAGLVYITAFARDKGESVNTLIANPPPGAPVPPILPPKDGYLFLDKVKFPAPSPATSIRRPPFSWPTPRYRGALTLLPARLQSRRGSPSPAGISKSAMTR